MKDIILIGGGGHCKSVIDVIEQESKFNIIGIVDKSEYLGYSLLGYPYIGTDTDLPKLAKTYKSALITIGQIKFSSTRINLYNLAINAGFILPKIISPTAYVSNHSSVGNGTVVMHNAVVNASTSIGDNCIINTSALVEHDCTISNHCHVSTNVTINGGVIIESGSFIGSSVTVKELIEINKNSFIKAGSIVK